MGDKLGESPFGMMRGNWTGEGRHERYVNGFLIGSLTKDGDFWQEFVVHLPLPDGGSHEDSPVRVTVDAPQLDVRVSRLDGGSPGGSVDQGQLAEATAFPNCDHPLAIDKHLCGGTYSSGSSMQWDIIDIEHGPIWSISQCSNAMKLYFFLPKLNANVPKPKAEMVWN